MLFSRSGEHFLSPWKCCCGSIVARGESSPGKILQPRDLLKFIRATKSWRHWFRGDCTRGFEGFPRQGFFVTGCAQDSHPWDSREFTCIAITLSMPAELGTRICTRWTSQKASNEPATPDNTKTSRNNRSIFSTSSCYQLYPKTSPAFKHPNIKPPKPTLIQFSTENKSRTGNTSTTNCASKQTPKQTNFRDRGTRDTPSIHTNGSGSKSH